MSLDNCYLRRGNPSELKGTSHLETLWSPRMETAVELTNPRLLAPMSSHRSRMAAIATII